MIWEICKIKLIKKEGGMVEIQFNKAKGLKRKAAALRNRGKLERALNTLDNVIEEIKRLLKVKEVDSGLALEMRRELTDSYGMKGGVYRRINDLNAALNEYEKGYELEKSDQHSTYNLSNTITLGICLGKTSPADAEMQKRLEKVITPLEKNTKGARSDEWWAWSDLGQFYLLLNRFDEAQRCYNSGRETGPTSEEFKRHISILVELAQATAENAPEISKGIEETIVRLRIHSPIRVKKPMTLAFDAHTVNTDKLGFSRSMTPNRGAL